MRRLATGPVIDEGQSLEAQRRNNLPASAMENTVFGHEIFSNKNLSFAPDLNIPTPKDYVLSAGDELLINVWGDSELNLKLKISPDGTILTKFRSGVGQWIDDRWR